MKSPYELLVVDIDGTLLNSRGIISGEDTEAIDSALKAGVQVVLSTGRAAMASGWVLDHLKLNGYHIFFDGALVYNPENNSEAYAEPISGQLARQVIDFARRQDIHIDLYSSTSYFIERESWAADIRRDFFRIEPTLGNLDEISERERVIKGTVIIRTPEEKALAVEFQNRFRGRLSFSWTMTPAYPDVDFINVVSPRVSKGKALEELCTLLAIPPSRVMAIGDGVNDISLLKTAGLAVAMGNCVDELRSVAHIVTHDVDHSGVAEAIRKYLL